MPRPKGCLGETKLKILAIIYRNELNGKVSYGYAIWTTLKEELHCYLDLGNLRNVYRHLNDLLNLGLVRKSAGKSVDNAPRRQLYHLTKDGRQLKHDFKEYFHILET
ncbi:MAG: helix-turn-helix transcriptional regulator [Thermoproteota archaeon]